MPIQQRVILVFIVIILVLGALAVGYQMMPKKSTSTNVPTTLYSAPDEKTLPKLNLKVNDIAEKNQLQQKEGQDTKKEFSTGDTSESSGSSSQSNLNQKPETQTTPQTSPNILLDNNPETTEQSNIATDFNFQPTSPSEPDPISFPSDFNNFNVDNSVEPQN
jgi:hypothetical protein